MTLQSVFWKQISMLQNVLMLADSGMSSLLDMKLEDFLIAKKIQGSISLSQLDVLLDKLGISIDNFFEGKIDYIQVRDKFLGNLEALPVRYDSVKLSKARTLTNCLRYIEMKYGEAFKNSILRQLQVDPRFFDNPNRLTNIRLMKDLFDLLESVGFSKQDFTNMGLMSYDINKASSMGEQYRSYRNFEELMEDLCNGLSSNYDQNYDYFIVRKDSESITLGSRPSAEVLEYLKADEIGSDRICQTKLGVLSSLPKYLKYEFSDAQKVKCMREGNSHYEYKINYSK